MVAPRVADAAAAGVRGGAAERQSTEAAGHLPGHRQLLRQKAVRLLPVPGPVLLHEQTDGNELD